MNQTEIYSMNTSKVPTQGAENGYHSPGEGFHPGYTTLISLGILILIIIIYLYYEDVLRILKNVCTGRPSSSNTGDRKDTVTKLVYYSDITNRSSNMNDAQTKTILTEPIIKCECGQVHILKECLNDKELERYSAAIRHLSLAGLKEIKYSSVVEDTNETSNPGNLTDKSVDKSQAEVNRRVPRAVVSSKSSPSWLEISHVSTPDSTASGFVVNRANEVPPMKLATNFDCTIPTYSIEHTETEQSNEERDRHDLDTSDTT